MIFSIPRHYHRPHPSYGRSIRIADLIDGRLEKHGFRVACAERDNWLLAERDGAGNEELTGIVSARDGEVVAVHGDRNLLDAIEKEFERLSCFEFNDRGVVDRLRKWFDEYVRFYGAEFSDWKGYTYWMLLSTICDAIYVPRPYFGADPDVDVVFAPPGSRRLDWYTADPDLLAAWEAYTVIAAKVPDWILSTASDAQRSEWDSLRPAKERAWAALMEAVCRFLGRDVDELPPSLRVSEVKNAA